MAPQVPKPAVFRHGPRPLDRATCNSVDRVDHPANAAGLEREQQSAEPTCWSLRRACSRSKPAQIPAPGPAAAFPDSLATSQQAVAAADCCSPGNGGGLARHRADAAAGAQKGAVSPGPGQTSVFAHSLATAEQALAGADCRFVGNGGVSRLVATTLPLVLRSSHALGGLAYCRSACGCGRAPGSSAVCRRRRGWLTSQRRANVARPPPVFHRTGVMVDVGTSSGVAHLRSVVSSRASSPRGDG